MTDEVTGVPDRVLHDDTAPTRVGGRYVLHDELGRGGMATVQRAHDEVLDRTVAVKLLHDHLATDPAFLDRFRREARAAAALDHPNVVAVHDWGETDDGAYLVLQLIDGPSLREVLRTHGSLSPAATLAVLGPASAGLAAAHAAGLVHRDVKPENLLLGRDGGVRVTDFGLARAAASATSTFGADVLVGSPHYLSPEAVRGLPLDPRADVYALGVVLFECLTGRPPHEGESPFATAVAHTARPVPAPSSLVPDLDPELDEVVRRATAIDRDERYADAASFGRALSHAVPGGPKAATSVTGVPTALVGPVAPADTGTRVVEPEHGDTTIVDGDHPGRRRAGTFRSHGSNRVWVAVVVLAALIGGSGVGGYLLWDRVLAPVTPIPGVLGAESDLAQQQLRDAGFEVAIASERPHDLAVPVGHVLEQSPSGATRLGRTITLVVSDGPRQLPIPDVVGAEVEDASERLTDAGFVPVIVEQHDESVPPGEVIASDPAPDEVRDEASEVELGVSIGPRPIEVPSLIGGSEAEAGTVADEVGLEVNVVDRRHDDGSREGTVLVQHPDAGATLHRGDTVDIVVSRGPERIEVPNVRGKRLDEALEELRALGLEVEFERRGGFIALINPGRVYEQDPGPGSTLIRGEQVFLWAYED